MKALKCDICGEFFDYNKMESTKLYYANNDGAINKEFDVCPKCWAAMVKAFDDRRIQALPMVDGRK